MLELFAGNYNSDASAGQLTTLKEIRGFSFGGSLARAVALGAFIGGHYAIFKPKLYKPGETQLRDFDGLCPQYGFPHGALRKKPEPHLVDPAVHIMLCYNSQAGRQHETMAYFPIPGFPREATRIFMRPTSWGVEIPTLSLGVLAAIESALPSQAKRYVGPKADFIEQVASLRASGNVPSEEFPSDRTAEQIAALGWQPRPILPFDL